MALQLTGTWEQAVLAATVRAAANKDGFLGRTALQKILYFLQASGLPMRYRFDIYHYGPYCSRISRDVEWLIADGVLKDASPNTEKYANYRISNAADELIQMHQAELQPHLATIDKVVKVLLPLRPERLEMLATLDYLYRQLKVGGGSGPWKERVVDRFLEVKKDKFERADVSAAYNEMASVNLFEA